MTSPSVTRVFRDTYLLPEWSFCVINNINGATERIIIYLGLINFLYLFFIMNSTTITAECKQGLKKYSSTSEKCISVLVKFSTGAFFFPLHFQVCSGLDYRISWFYCACFPLSPLSPTPGWHDRMSIFTALVKAVKLSHSRSCWHTETH